MRLWSEREGVAKVPYELRRALVRSETDTEAGRGMAAHSTTRTRTAGGRWWVQPVGVRDVHDLTTLSNAYAPAGVRPPPPMP